ncbi:MAG TPA: hypothetical protein VII51_10480 [Gaiellaceae bacterium]
MRRIVLACVGIAALGLPAAVSAMLAAPGDGSLVVKGASGPRSGTVPVVALTITGAAIGHVDQGHIVIDDPTPNNGASPEVTPGAGVLWRKDSKVSDTAQAWGGTDFKFRAVGGKYTILIYGSGVDVVAIGTGTVTLTGLVDNPSADGTFSLDGSDFHSLPGQTTKQLQIVAPPTSFNG